MKLIVLTAGFAIAQLLAPAAHANEPGPKFPDAQYVKPTPEEKAAAKATRKQAGKQANKDYLPDPAVRIPAPVAKVDRAEKQAARAERKTETKRALKAGEVAATGEVGQSR